MRPHSTEGLAAQNGLLLVKPHTLLAADGACPEVTEQREGGNCSRGGRGDADKREQVKSS